MVPTPPSVTTVPSHDHDAAAPQAPARALGLLLLLACLAPLLLLAAPWAPAAHAAPPVAVEIDDEQGIIEDPDALAAQLAETSFRDGAAYVELRVLTLDIGAQGADPDADTGLNDAVRNFATAEHPDWIDGEKWADHLVILAIDPENRKVGTYAGEDVKLSDSGFEDVQDAMKDDAEDGDWARSFVAGAEEYADLLARPWWQGPGAIIGAFLALIALGAGIATALGRGVRARRRVRTARERHEDVRAKRRETDQAAARIPRDSVYGASILADVEDYRRAACEAEGLAARLPERPGPLWGVAGGAAGLAKEYEQSVRTADDADDTIIGAARLLGRTGDVAGAWQLERQPLDESLAAVEDTIAQAGLGDEAPGGAADALRHAAREVAGELEDVSRDYLQGARTPDECLERLDELTDRLSLASTNVREEVIGASAHDEEEAELMRDALPEGFTRDFPTSVRGRRFARHPEDYVSGYSLSPVLWTGAWYGGATSALDTHRNPPATSGSTGGYSGGGFSGAGSSSSF
jgi:predicted DNA-binding protein